MPLKGRRLVRLAGVLFTPWHPVRIITDSDASTHGDVKSETSSQWHFPAQLPNAAQATILCGPFNVSTHWQSYRNHMSVMLDS